MLRVSVTEYDQGNGLLYLQHPVMEGSGEVETTEYPSSTKTRLSSCVIAEIDIEHVLDSLQNTEVSVGAWLNIVGYVQNRNQGSSLRSNDQSTKRTRVQAVLLWNAGSLNIATYLTALTGKEQCCRAIQSL